MSEEQTEMDVLAEAMDAVRDQAQVVAFGIEDALDRETRRRLEEGMNGADPARALRLKYAYVAANITEDRYSAGSTAARVAIIALLRDGPQAAIDFVADLEHHEH